MILCTKGYERREPGSYLDPVEALGAPPAVDGPCLDPLPVGAAPAVCCRRVNAVLFFEGSLGEDFAVDDDHVVTPLLDVVGAAVPIAGFIFVQHFWVSFAIWIFAFCPRLDKCHRRSQIFPVAFGRF